MPTIKQQAAIHIREALKTGVRGDLRNYLTKALQAAEGQRVAGLNVMDYDNLAPGGVLVDPDRPGFIMRATKKSGKVWHYRHRHNGQRAEAKLGTYPALSVADARIAWSESREAIRAGEPVTTTATQKNESTLTMRTFVERYLKEYAEPFKRSWRMDESYLTKYILPHYGRIDAAKFGPEQVRAILSPISARAPREAEKVRGVLSSMFNIGIKGSRKMGNLDGGTWLPPDMVNPVSRVILPARETQNHKPTNNELEALLRAVGGEGDSGAAILLQALTCARVTETAALPWSEVDLKARTWSLPASRSKNGVEHVVMLTDQAVALLEARKDNGSDFVFPGAKSAAHLTRNSIGKAFTRIRKANKLSDGFTSHGLRHACLTWLAENGASRDIRDRISNHVDNSGSDAIYNAAELNAPAREWLQKWADHLDILRAENVVSLETRA